MKFLKILSGALVGTSLMTIFSYSLSKLTNRKFKEPELLNKLINRPYLSDSAVNNRAAGWLLHYSVGTGFVICYHFIWKRKFLNIHLKSSSFLGLISGFIGICGWHILFMMHSNPPSVQLKNFYIHLLAAHIIFGWGAAMGYRQLLVKDLDERLD